MKADSLRGFPKAKLLWDKGDARCRNRTSKAVVTQPMNDVIPPMSSRAYSLAAHLLREAGRLTGMVAAGVRPAVAEVVRAADARHIGGGELTMAELLGGLRGELSSDPGVRGRQLQASAYFAVAGQVDDGQLDGFGLGQGLLQRLRYEFAVRLPEGQGDHQPLPDMAWLDAYSPASMRFGDAPVAAASVVTRLIDGQVERHVAALCARVWLRRARLAPELWLLARNMVTYTPDDGCDRLLKGWLGQVQVMAAMVDRPVLLGRVMDVAMGGGADSRVGRILAPALAFGGVPRADVPGLLGTGERHARRLLEPLVKQGLLVIPGPRELWRVGFPLAYADRLFPGLFSPLEPAPPWQDDWGRFVAQPQEGEGGSRSRPLT